MSHLKEFLKVSALRLKARSFISVSTFTVRLCFSRVSVV